MSRRSSRLFLRLFVCSVVEKVVVVEEEEDEVD